MSSLPKSYFTTVARSGHRRGYCCWFSKIMFSSCLTRVSRQETLPLFSNILHNRERFFKDLVSQFSSCFKGCQFTIFQFFLAFVFEQQLNKTWFPTFFAVAFEDSLINRMCYCLNESFINQVNRFFSCFLG